MNTGNHDIVVIGASMGGVEGLKTLVAQLPADLNAAGFIVIGQRKHIDPRVRGGMNQFRGGQASIRGERVAVKVIVQSHRAAIVADL